MLALGKMSVVIKKLSTFKIAVGILAQTTGSLKQQYILSFEYDSV